MAEINQIWIYLYKKIMRKINNEGNYEPNNLRWATRIQQSNNSRRWRVK